MRRIIFILVAMEFITAFVVCHEVFAESSSESERLYEQGLEQLDRSEFEEAVKSFSQAIELQPEFADAYSARGTAYEGLAPQLEDPDERERAALRVISDRHKAAELRAEIQILKELAPLKRIAPITGVVYLALWGGLIYFWKAKRFSLVWPVLGFFFCGPIGLIVLGFYALTAGENPSLPEKPFEDHPLEVALRENAGFASADQLSDDEKRTMPCPKCGRINSVRTRICPRCEYRST